MREREPQCTWREPCRSPPDLRLRALRANGHSGDPLGVTWVKCGIFHDSYILKTYRSPARNQFMNKISALGARSFSCLPSCGGLGYKVPCGRTRKSSPGAERPLSLYSFLLGTHSAGVRLPAVLGTQCLRGELTLSPGGVIPDRTGHIRTQHAVS